MFAESLFAPASPDFVELSDLQEMIGERIGFLEQWVRVEIESFREVRGHYYFDFVQKSPDGRVLARCGGRVWRSGAHVIRDFEAASGERVRAGITVVALCEVSYSAQYGLALIINEIDPGFTVGLKELERKKTIGRLTEEGLLEAQKEFVLPLLPGRIAVVSSADAAGYGDFVRHLDGNQRGYKFDLTLFPALMQEAGCPEAVAEALRKIASEGGFDAALILRGGGSEADLEAFDDYAMCRAVALCPFPVLTAIGHERDFHIADMVAFEHFKTPTALADFLIEWVRGAERQMEDSLSGIRFALASAVGRLESELALRLSAIKDSDPRRILRQGYLLAQSMEGRMLKSAAALRAGDDFRLRFGDGLWECSIREVKLENKS